MNDDEIANFKAKYRLHTEQAMKTIEEVFNGHAPVVGSATTVGSGGSSAATATAVVVDRLSQDHIYANMQLYNTNNLWADQHVARPDDYVTTIDRAMTNRWIHPDTPSITLDRSDVKWMAKAAHIGMMTGRPSPLYKDELMAAVAKYEAQIPDYANVSPSGWFIRTNRVSLKNGIHGVGPYTSMKNILESCITSNSGHECVSERDVVDGAPPFKLYFVGWVAIVQEFRVFVYQNRISAISTQHYSEINDWMCKMTDAEIAHNVAHKIETYFREKLRDRLAGIVGPNYTMDIAFLENGSVYFIEPNSFGANYAAGSAAFNWVYDHDALHRETDTDPIHVKFVDRE